MKKIANNIVPVVMFAIVTLLGVLLSFLCITSYLGNIRATYQVLVILVLLLTLQYFSFEQLRGLLCVIDTEAFIIMTVQRVIKLSLNAFIILTSIHLMLYGVFENFSLLACLKSSALLGVVIYTYGFVTLYTLDKHI